MAALLRRYVFAALLAAGIEGALALESPTINFVWNSSECAISPEKIYTIENVNAIGLYMNVQGNKQSRRANIQLFDNPDETSTQWRIAEISAGIYTVENVNAAGMYMNVQGSKKELRTNIQLYDNPGETSTQWRIAEISAGIYTFENVNAVGMYANVQGSRKDLSANIQLYDNPGETSTQWRLVEARPPPPSPSPPGDNPLHIKPHPRRSDNFFFITADWGAPAGKTYGCQKKVAQLMRDYQSKREKEGKKLLFVLAGGDNFYWTGMSKKSMAYQFAHQWKNVYTSLTDVPWLAVYGNHDHGSQDPGCACGKGCNQHNSAGRTPGAEKYWMPDYYWHYLIPEIKLEVIGLDMNAVDLNGIGGSGCDHGAKETCKLCGGIHKIQEFLGKKKAEGEAYMDHRAKVTPATTVAILQHYPGGVSKGLLERFQKASGGKAKVLSAAGHTHNQYCQGSRTHGCDVILTGGGGGVVDSKYLGFTAVHLTDDGGYQVVLETSEVRFPSSACKWEDLDTDVEYMASSNHTMVEEYVI